MARELMSREGSDMASSEVRGQLAGQPEWLNCHPDALTGQFCIHKSAWHLYLLCLPQTLVFPPQGAGPCLCRKPALICSPIKVLNFQTTRGTIFVLSHGVDSSNSQFLSASPPTSFSVLRMAIENLEYL